VLRKQGKKKFNRHRGLDAVSERDQPEHIKIVRTLMIDGVTCAQRFATARRDAGSGAAPDAAAAGDRRTARLRAQVVHFINKPMPGKLPKRTARALLELEDRHVVPIIRDPAKVTEDSDAVF